MLVTTRSRNRCPFGSLAQPRLLWPTGGRRTPRTYNRLEGREGARQALAHFDQRDAGDFRIWRAQVGDQCRLRYLVVPLTNHSSLSAPQTCALGRDGARPNLYPLMACPADTRNPHSLARAQEVGACFPFGLSAARSAPATCDLGVQQTWRLYPANDYPNGSRHQALEATLIRRQASPITEKTEARADGLPARPKVLLSGVPARRLVGNNAILQPISSDQLP